MNQNLQVNTSTRGFHACLQSEKHCSGSFCSPHTLSVWYMRTYQILLKPFLVKTCCHHAQMRWLKVFCKYWALSPESAEDLISILGPAHNCYSPDQTHNEKNFRLDNEFSQLWHVITHLFSHYHSVTMSYSCWNRYLEYNTEWIRINYRICLQRVHV